MRMTNLPPALLIIVGGLVRQGMIRTALEETTPTDAALATTIPALPDLAL